jgi:hypothetical protein
MTTIVLVGVAIALVLFAIIVKARAGRPKRLEKGEKAQIVKRLLALSERENMANGISCEPSASQTPAPRRRAEAGRTLPVPPRLR